MTPIRIPALAVALASLALPAGAQTTNPLGSGLPLTVHTLASCISFNNVSPGSIVDEHSGAAAASCSAATNAQAFADIATGTLRATVESESTSVLHQAGIAKAALYDALTFSGFTGTTVVTVNMHVHGSFSADPLAGGGDVNAFIISTALPVGFHLHEGSAGDLYFPEAPTGPVTTNADPITGLFPRSDVRIDMSRSFAVTVGSPVWFMAQINLTSGGANEVTDFGHTAELSLDLPAGVTYTSASGLFLTGVAAPVPEPETAWLLLAGILPIAARAWRRARDSERDR